MMTTMMMFVIVALVSIWPFPATLWPVLERKPHTHLLDSVFLCTVFLSVPCILCTLHISHLVFALCFSNCPAYSGIDSKRQFPLISWTRICVFTTEASQSSHVGSDNTVRDAQNWLLCFVYNVFSYNFRDEHCAVYNVFLFIWLSRCALYSVQYVLDV